MHRPLRLICDKRAVSQNYAALQERSATVVGAAVKADAYGLGVATVVETLLEAGCRDFFVSTWSEAAAVALPPEARLAVLHGFGTADSVIPGVRPVLNSVEQVRRWRSLNPDGLSCDVMVDTGMNRLGLSLTDLAALDGLQIHTLHSHLACADEDHPLNQLQLKRFREIASAIPANRYSLANSAAILIGREFAFDLVRPGLSLYGGIPRAEGEGVIQRVASLHAQVVQTRKVNAGDTVGYNATYVARRDHRIAILNIGYADGYFRGFSDRGYVRAAGARLPVVGRVSMDLTAVDLTDQEVAEGDWLEIEWDLPSAARQSGMSQYELLTGLGSRFERRWI